MSTSDFESCQDLIRYQHRRAVATHVLQTGKYGSLFEYAEKVVVWNCGSTQIFQLVLRSRPRRIGSLTASARMLTPELLRWAAARRVAD